MATTTDPNLHAALATLESEYGLAPTTPHPHHGVGE